MGAQGRTIRVCSDPNNMPFSNRAGEGFENRVAELIGRDLGAKVEYTWWVQRKNFAKTSLEEGACDLIVGVAAGYPSVLTTRPWYRSRYVLISRKIGSLDDPALQQARVGIHITGENYAPPATMFEPGQLVGFSLFGAEGEKDPPAKLVRAVISGAVDAAAVWGPFAGYFGRGLHMLALPYEFDIAAAVRQGNTALRDEVQAVLDKERAEVRSILTQYGVPLCESR